MLDCVCVCVCVVVCVSMAENKIGDDGARAMREALGVNSSLLTLKFGGNLVGTGEVVLMGSGGAGGVKEIGEKMLEEWGKTDDRNMEKETCCKVELRVEFWFLCAYSRAT